VYFCFVWHGVGTGKFRREPRCDGHRIFYAGHTNITHVLEWQNYVFVYQKMHQVAPCGRHHLLFKMTLDHYSFFFLFLLGGGVDKRDPGLWGQQKRIGDELLAI